MDKQARQEEDRRSEQNMYKGFTKEVCSPEFADGCRHPLNELPGEAPEEPDTEEENPDIPEQVCAPEFPDGCITPLGE